MDASGIYGCWFLAAVGIFSVISEEGLHPKNGDEPYLCQIYCCLSSIYQVALGHRPFQPLALHFCQTPVSVYTCYLAGVWLATCLILMADSVMGESVSDALLASASSSSISDPDSSGDQRSK